MHGWVQTATSSLLQPACCKTPCAQFNHIGHIIPGRCNKAHIDLGCGRFDWRGAGLHGGQYRISLLCVAVMAPVTHDVRSNTCFPLFLIAKFGDKTRFPAHSCFASCIHTMQEAPSSSEWVDSTASGQQALPITDNAKVSKGNESKLVGGGGVKERHSSPLGVARFTKKPRYPFAMISFSDALSEPLPSVG